MFSEEGRLRYDTPKNINQVRMVIIEIDGELYDSNDRIEIEESIRKILAEVNLEDNIERL